MNIADITTFYHTNQRYPQDVIERLLTEKITTPNTTKCHLLIVHYEDKEGNQFTKNYGAFKDEKLLALHTRDIIEKINRKTDFEINLDEDADHLLYHLKELIDYENSIVGYEIKELKLYE